MKASEILSLLHGNKQVVRHLFSDKELPNIKQFCVDNRLHLSLSTYKVRLIGEGFTDSGKRSDKGLTIVYISSDEKLAYLANLSEMREDHEGLGSLLSYPDCCIDFFRDKFSPKNTNLEFRPSNPYTNLSLRGKDICLLSHFPCQNDCQESINQAKERLNLVEMYDKKLAFEIFTQLQIR